MLKMSWRGNGSRGESKERREWRKVKVKTNGMHSCESSCSCKLILTLSISMAIKCLSATIWPTSPCTPTHAAKVKHFTGQL